MLCELRAYKIYHITYLSYEFDNLDISISQFPQYCDYKTWWEASQARIFKVIIVFIYIQHTGKYTKLNRNFSIDIHYNSESKVNIWIKFFNMCSILITSHNEIRRSILSINVKVAIFHCFIKIGSLIIISVN